MNDQVCLARASEEFKLSSSVLENAIKIGFISAETKGKCCQILLSKKEIEEKLPLLRTGSRFLRLINQHEKKQPTYREPKANYIDFYNEQAQVALRLEKVKLPIEQEERKIVKLEGNPWTTSPCINCHDTCDPVECELLSSWVRP